MQPRLRRKKLDASERNVKQCLGRLQRLYLELGDIQDRLTDLDDPETEQFDFEMLEVSMMSLSRALGSVVLPTKRAIKKDLEESEQEYAEVDGRELH